jgi:uncharacterized protein (UPF0303 family)
VAHTSAWNGVVKGTPGGGGHLPTESVYTREGDNVDGTVPGRGAPTIVELEEQERTLVLSVADLAALHALGARMYDAAVAGGLPLSIQVRIGERLVYAASAPGSAALNDDWAARKARVVHLFERSSLLVRLTHERDGISFDEKHRLPGDRYAPFGGAFPLRVTVSGLPQLEDHAFVVRLLRDHVRAS